MITHEVMYANWGPAPGRNAGGVGRHSPTLVPPRNGGGGGVKPRCFARSRWRQQPPAPTLLRGQRLSVAPVARPSHLSCLGSRQGTWHGRRQRCARQQRRLRRQVLVRFHFVHGSSGANVLGNPGSFDDRFAALWQHAPKSVPRSGSHDPQCKPVPLLPRLRETAVPALCNSVAGSTSSSIADDLAAVP
jgi:hypothetical protein